MSSALPNTRLDMIQAAKQKAETRWRKLQRLDTVAITASVVAAALVTLLTAFSAATNDPVFFERWQSLSWLAASLSAAATIAGGLRQGLGTSDKLQKAGGCVGQLQALSYGLSVGSISLDQADKAYQEVIANYPECLI